ncbi:hypothetical protein TcWFU_000178 [Taenia crassiceps]|uniref:Uncharacterized protein n=1 Tax=Taenia crassiceps TaxID=6207 RepID=A0ABR4Q4E0_9CEST
MCAARRSTKETVAALTARQYREAKKLELRRLKLQVEMFKDAYLHYKKLYEESQVELKALSESSIPTSSDSAPSCGPKCVSPSFSPDLNFVLDSDLTYENLEDPMT